MGAESSKFSHELLSKDGMTMSISRNSKNSSSIRSGIVSKVEQIAIYIDPFEIKQEHFESFKINNHFEKKLEEINIPGNIKGKSTPEEYYFGTKNNDFENEKTSAGNTASSTSASHKASDEKKEESLAKSMKSFTISNKISSSTKCTEKDNTVLILKHLVKLSKKVKCLKFSQNVQNFKVVNSFNKEQLINTIRENLNISINTTSIIKTIESKLSKIKTTVRIEWKNISKEAFISGSFNNWNKVVMKSDLENQSHTYELVRKNYLFLLLKDLGQGEHHFKLFSLENLKMTVGSVLQLNYLNNGYNNTYENLEKSFYGGGGNSDYTSIIKDDYDFPNDPQKALPQTLCDNFAAKKNFNDYIPVK